MLHAIVFDQQDIHDTGQGVTHNTASYERNVTEDIGKMLFCFPQEEEKRIASVMARKEEEKKKEISKLAVLKVV